MQAGPSSKVFHKCKQGRFYLSIMAVCICACCAFNGFGDTVGPSTSVDSPTEDAINVIVQFNTDDNETRYSISRGDCSITWITRHVEPDVIKHSASCNAPLVMQLPLLIKLCEHLYGDGENARKFDKLFWGGLKAENKPASDEMSFRLSLAAFKSPGWDTKKGKPKKGDLYRFVKDLANKEMIYPELKALFEHFHRFIVLASIEKVRVGKADELPFYDQLKKKGVKPADKLPFDFMAWFLVSNEVRKP